MKLMELMRLLLGSPSIGRSWQAVVRACLVLHRCGCSSIHGRVFFKSTAAAGSLVFQMPAHRALRTCGKDTEKQLARNRQQGSPGLQGLLPNSSS